MSDKIAKTIQHYESMSSAEILAELDRLGIDARPTIDAVKSIVEAHRHHHGRRGVHAPAAMILGTANAFTRGYGKSTAAARKHAAALQRGFFSPSDEVVLRLQHSATVDEAYIHFGAVTGLAIEVSGHCGQLMNFAATLAQLAPRWTVAVQCVLVHSIRHWLSIGADMHELATAVRHELRRHRLSAEAHRLLAGAGCVEVSALRDAALSAMWRSGGGFGGEPSFTGLVEKLQEGIVPSFLAMDALGSVFLCALELGHHDDVKQWVMDHISGGPPSHFAVLQSLAAVRQAHPHFAAGLLADVVLAHSHAAGHIAFSMIVEGYERSFGGVRQPHVPHFEHGAQPRFVPAVPHALDLFGHRLCQSHIAHELGDEMERANRRLGLWADGGQVGHRP